MVTQKSPIAVIVGCCLLVAVAAWWAGQAGRVAFTIPSSPARAQLAGLQLPFIANQGQTDPRVAYYAPTFAGTVFVTRDGKLVYGLPAKSRRGSLPETGSDETSNVSGGWALTETFVNGNPRPVAGDVAPVNVSYFIGDDPKYWRPHASSHTSIALGEVWPGIAVHVEAHGRHVEKLFTIAPRADVSNIRMRVDGANRLSIADDGALVFGTGLGEVMLTAPIAWQEKDGERTPVAVAYVLRNEEYGFTLGDHDPGLPVIIDPLLQSSYLGGSGFNENAYSIAIHPTTGEVYVVGRTGSIDFPGTTGGAQPANGGAGGTTDAFVARFNANLTALLQATYLGGSANDQGDGIVIHPSSGEIYATGLTSSVNFPNTAGGAQPALAVGAGTPSDAFIARLDANLTTLIQATYLGGTGLENGTKIAIHPTSGEVYVAGPTNSTDFPGTAGGAQPVNPGAGTFHGYVARLNANLTALNQATYFGGTSTDRIYKIAIHPATGEVYVAGDTASTNLPSTAGGAQPASGGITDAFIARLNANLTVLNQSTYFGGGNIDTGVAFAIHPTTGEVYLTGLTFSADLSSTTGGAQPANGGGTTDAYLAWLNANLTVLNQTTYLGGSANDDGAALVIHPSSGEVYVAGSTSSTNFPGTTGGAQPANGGGGDAFTARLNANLTTLNQATYLGGSANDSGTALAIHSTTGEVYIAGNTVSTDLPGTTGGAQPAINGASDTFVARISADLLAASLTADLAITKTDAPDPVIAGANLTYTITATNNGPGAATGVTVTDALPASATFVSSAPSQGSCSGTTTVTCNLGGLANGASATIIIVVTPTVTGALSNTATVTAVETDPNAANNSATAATTVIAASADLAVTISASSNPASVNSALSYIAQVTNNGALSATGVTLTSTLTGGGFTFDSITPSQGSCVGTTAATCTLGALANGANATVTIVVTPTAVGTVTLSDAVSATQPDANAANNNALLAVSTVNTVCSNGARGVATTNVSGSLVAGCAATVGSTSAGGGGSVELATLAMLLLLACGRRIAPARIRPRRWER